MHLGVVIKGDVNEVKLSQVEGMEILRRQSLSKKYPSYFYLLTAKSKGQSCRESKCQTYIAS